MIGILVLRPAAGRSMFAPASTPGATVHLGDRPPRA